MTWTRLPPLSTRLQTILDESYSREPLTPISNEEQSGESPPPLSLDSCATYSLSDILGCAQNSTTPMIRSKCLLLSIGQCFTDLNSQSQKYAGGFIPSQQNSTSSGYDNISLEMVPQAFTWVLLELSGAPLFGTGS